MEARRDPLPCPICGGSAPALDVVDFNKSCAESWGKLLPLSGIPVYYHLCAGCGFCFAPEFQSWSQQDFAERIYNAGYAEVDPEYSGKRPKACFEMVEQLFGKTRAQLRHLDYGSGAGLLSRMLAEAGWQSVSYDPFTDSTDPGGLGKFDLVTAFEVFEHVPDIAGLVRRLESLMSAQSLLLVSTLLSDGKIAQDRRLTWWYASPSNGHISLFSRRSLGLTFERIGFKVGSFSPAVHLAYRELPGWASHINERRET